MGDESLICTPLSLFFSDNACVVHVIQLTETVARYTWPPMKNPLSQKNVLEGEQL